MYLAFKEVIMAMELILIIIHGVSHHNILRLEMLSLFNL